MQEIISIRSIKWLAGLHIDFRAKHSNFLWRTSSLLVYIVDKIKIHIKNFIMKIRLTLLLRVLRVNINRFNGYEMIRDLFHCDILKFEVHWCVELIEN